MFVIGEQLQCILQVLRMVKCSWWETNKYQKHQVYSAYWCIQCCNQSDTKRFQFQWLKYQWPGEKLWQNRLLLDDRVTDRCWHPLMVPPDWVIPWQNLFHASLSSHKFTPCICIHYFSALFCVSTHTWSLHFVLCLPNGNLFNIIFVAVRGILSSSVCNMCWYHCILNLINFFQCFYFQILPFGLVL